MRADSHGPFGLHGTRTPPHGLPVHPPNGLTHVGLSQRGQIADHRPKRFVQDMTQRWRAGSGGADGSVDAVCAVSELPRVLPVVLDG